MSSLPKSETGFHRSSEKAPITWEHARDFADKTSGLTVRVTRSSGFRPCYSFEIGRVIVEKLLRHFAAFSDVDAEGTVTIRPFPIETLAGLIAEAEDWIRSQKQARENEIASEAQKQTPRRSK